VPPEAHRRRVLLTLVWLWVAVPFGYGVYELALKLRQLFSG
jgi:hypothetical protein